MPDEWQKFQLSGCECVSARFTLEAPVRDAGLIALQESTGWSHFLDGDGHHLIYAEKDQPLFSIAYADGSNTYTVAGFKGVLLRVIYTGVHYAMMHSLAGQAIGFHGVTMLCGDQVIILSAPSGTGKTTLATLLEKHCGGLVINGDFALLHPDLKEGVIFEPTPFCGTSGRCANYRLRVNRIVFLEQGRGNAYRSLSPREGCTRLLSNCFVPEWDAERTSAVQETALKIIEHVPMGLYSFEPTQEAAELFHSIVTPKIRASNI